MGISVLARLHLASPRNPCAIAAAARRPPNATKPPDVSAERLLSLTREGYSSPTATRSAGCTRA